MTEKVLKSFTEALVAKVGPLMNATFVAVSTGTPTLRPTVLVPLICKEKLCPLLSEVEAVANPVLTLR